MKHEDHFELRYQVPTAGGNWDEKVIRFTTVERKEANLKKCAEYGYKVVSCKKLYPLNTYANQHNFYLIYNICFNTMSDMECGDIPYDSNEYDKLEQRRDRAGYFATLPLPTAWLPYDEWVEAKEMYTAAVIHRGNACIENGRPDLVTYC